MSVSLEQLRQRLIGVDQRRQRFERQSEQTNGLRRHEVWRHAYLANPYLIGAPDDRVANRFRDVFMNVMELGPGGKLQLVAFTETDEYMQTFTHLLEEYGTRTGGPPGNLIASARAPVMKYFADGVPLGVRMFDGYAAPTTPILVKYGKREFLEPMFRTGEFRLANAGLYNDTSLLEAVRDDETTRNFFIPTYRERLDGVSHVVVRGHRIVFDDDDIVLPLEVDDYFLFSLCEHIHHRMPTDFEADAAIVIRDRALFQDRMTAAVLAKLPGWAPLAGSVTYYDPYRDYAKFRIPEMAKHFGYAYQKEFRIAFRARTRLAGKLEPIFLSIGSMTGYADLVSV